jgi:hypothetical protein
VVRRSENLKFWKIEREDLYLHVKNTKLIIQGLRTSFRSPVFQIFTVSELFTYQVLFGKRAFFHL